MNFKKWPVGLFGAAIFLLSACNPHASGIETKPVSLTLKTEKFAQRIVPTPTTPTTAVRTYMRSEDQKSLPEIAGAVCEVESSEMHAKFVTPAIVHFPIIKGRPEPLKLTCRTDTATAKFIVQPDRDGVVTIGPSIAGLVAAAISTTIVHANDRWTHGGEYWRINLTPQP